MNTDSSIDPTSTTDSITVEESAADASLDATPDGTDTDATETTPAGDDTGTDQPYARRVRGQLEADVKMITDKHVLGTLTLPEGAAMTPHFIALALQKEESLASPPSTGAVAAILQRWVRIGYATVTEKPFAFEGYTQAAHAHGLASLKATDADKKKAVRAAAKQATATAEADDAGTAAGESTSSTAAA